MSINSDLINAMIEYNSGDPKRIQHFMKVYEFASLICEKEHMDDATRAIIEMTAITHDIGIKLSEQKYNSSSGHYQQIEGPAEARKLLGDFDIKEAMIERICWLIGHHHTYTAIEAIDHQIIVEADFMVNIFEESMTDAAIASVKEKIFRTRAGIGLLESVYGSS